MALSIRGAREMKDNNATNKNIMNSRSFFSLVVVQAIQNYFPVASI